MNIPALREARAARVAEARALVDGNAQLTAEQQTRFDALKAEIVKIEADEARAQFLEDAERRAAGAPVDKPRAAMESGVNVLDAIRAQVEQRSVTGALAEFQQEAKRMGIEPKKGGLLVPASIFEKRTTQTTTTADKIVPDDYRADQFIGLLRNSLIVRSLGARVLSGLRGDVTLVDVEGGEGREVTMSPATLRAYAEAHERFCQTLAQSCRSRGIPYFRAETSVPFDELVLRMFRLGGLLR